MYRFRFSESLSISECGIYKEASLLSDRLPFVQGNLDCADQIRSIYTVYRRSLLRQEDPERDDGLSSSAPAPFRPPPPRRLPRRREQREEEAKDL